MSPVILIQLAGFILSLFFGFMNYNQYKMSGDMPTSVDWAAISIPALLAILAPYLIKLFPWLEPFLPDNKPAPKPDDKSIKDIQWDSLIAILGQILPIVFVDGKLNLVYLKVYVKDEKGNIYPIEYGKNPETKNALPSNVPTPTA